MRGEDAECPVRRDSVEDRKRKGFGKVGDVETPAVQAAIVKFKHCRLLLVPLVRYRVIDNIFAFKKRHVVCACRSFDARSLPLAPPFMQQSLVPL
jgi:hypothetical protein